MKVKLLITFKVMGWHVAIGNDKSRWTPKGVYRTDFWTTKVVQVGCFYALKQEQSEEQAKALDELD